MRLRRRPDLEVAPGERLLAWTTAADGTVVGGTRDALYLPERLPWEQVEAADWDSDTSTFRVREVGTWGAATQRARVHDRGARPADGAGA